MVSRKHAVAGAVVLLLCALLQFGAPEPAAAEPLPECNGRTMYFVAHEDDSLIFQSPALLQEVHSGRCIQTVYLTAGDAGKERSYWEEREVGNEAAYAEMAHVADHWTSSATVADGHSLSTETLTGYPQLTLVYMRLPDGNVTGEGFPRYGNQSLLELWRSANPGHGSPSIASVTTVDGTSTYSYAELVGTLSALIDTYQPRVIGAQDFAESLPSSFPGPDHPDHLISAYMVRTAAESYCAPHQLIAYKGYDVSSDPQNVTGTLLGAKQMAFYTYGKHDPETCVDEASCSTTEYGGWLKRQYATATLTTGVVADAGYAQEVVEGQKVTLDGSASSAAGGGTLNFSWTQTKGPPVTLSSATAAKPTFTTPDHPTVLRFALVVTEGATQSAADETIVRVPSSDPTPHADAGQKQTVPSGATVELDGSGSYDPNSEPLQYAWLQTGGPAVTLNGSGTANPTFEAPTGPTTLSFSLTVSNGVQVSAPANVQVVVKGIAPSFTSAASTSFTTDARGSFTVSADGSPVAAITLASGTLPGGVELTSTGNGTAALAGTPFKSDAPPGGSHVYEFNLKASNSEGSATQSFALTVVNPGAPARFLSGEAAEFVTEAPGSFEIVTSGEPDPALNLEGTLPEGLALTTGSEGTATIAGAPAATAAPLGGSAVYLLTVTATNAIAIATQPLAITVYNHAALKAPVFTSATSAEFTIGRPGSFKIRATGFPPPALSREGSLPTGVYFVVEGGGDATISGTPAAAAVPAGAEANYPIVLQAASIAGSASQQFTMRVVVEPKLSPSSGTAPTVTGSGAIAGIVGRPLGATLAASGTPPPSLSLSGPLPAGIGFSAGDGQARLAGTPSRAGEFHLSLTAVNDAGTATKKLTVEIDPRPRLQTSRLMLPVGRRSQGVVRVHAAAGARLRCRGHLPPGASCRAMKGQVVLRTTPRLRRTGSFKLKIAVASAGGTVTMPLVVRFGAPDPSRTENT